MSKILKNTTASEILISDIGLTITASGQLSIAAQDFDLLSASDDIVTLIGNGSVIINNGSEDLTKSDAIRLVQGGFTNKIKLEDDLVDSNRIKVDVVGTLSDGKLKISENDSTTGFLDSKIIVGSNKISKSINNAGNDEELQLDIVSANINTADLNNNANFINSAGAPVQASDIANFETSSQLNTRDASNRNRSNHTGTQLSSTISDFNTAVQNSETTTSLSFNPTSNILSYTDENGQIENIDLTQFEDDTNLSRIVNGVLDDQTGIATFTRDDSTTFTVDLSSLLGGGTIGTHETTINNHDDVDVTTTTPNTGDLLSYDGTNWTPKRKQYKKHARQTSGQINQTTTLESFLTLSDTIPETGLYKVSWSYSWSLNSTGKDFIAQVQINNSDTIHQHQQEVKDSAGTGITLPNTSGGNTNSSTNQRYTNSGFDVVTISAGALTIDLDWRCEVANIEPAMYKATLTIEEWEE